MTASRVGKNNLYKLFICCAFELFRAGGILSFIVLMPFAGTSRRGVIQNMLLEGREFRQIHSFPQKDNPALRVFRDAKLSTALFVYRKGPVDTESPSICRVHPEQYIDAQSPSLYLTSLAVGRYDPVNLFAMAGLSVREVAGIQERLAFNCRE